MNLVLFKANIKNNWMITLLITLVLTMYATISISMFDPVDASSFNDMLDMLPKGMVDALGFSGIGTELTGYLAGYLYGFLIFVFPMIFTVIMSHRLVGKLVDNGSMAYLLTTPHSRVKIITTQALFLVLSATMIILINVLIMIGLSQFMFPGMLQVGRFLLLNLVSLMCILFSASIGFFFSCMFNDAKNSLAFGSAIPIFFFVTKMIGGISDKVSFFKWMSIYSLIDSERILGDGNYAVIVSGVLFVAVSSIFAAAIYMFNKRSLAL